MYIVAMRCLQKSYSFYSTIVSHVVEDTVVDKVQIKGPRNVNDKIREQ